MFEETLIKGAKENLALLGRSGILNDAYLAGGTAAALQLGHRISVDFDFFTTQEFVPKLLSAEFRIAIMSVCSPGNLFKSRH